MFSIYTSNTLGVPSNCSYQNKHIVTDEASFKEAVSHDYVCAEYENNYRKNSNFKGADCLPVDCDNDHSNNPEDWIYPSDVADAFPDVTFAVHYSRNHMKEKNGKAARPKFHVLFPIDRITDAEEYSEIKKQVNKVFPFFDNNALDSARFFFGTESPSVEIHLSSTNLTSFLADYFVSETNLFSNMVIPEGRRNATLYQNATCILKRYGDTANAKNMFLERAEQCSPPLDKSELKTIWSSALRFYKMISSQEGYVPPEEYNKGPKYKPDDFTDVAQGDMLATVYADELRYSPSTDYLVYNGSYWEESTTGAQYLAQTLTQFQLEESEAELRKATDEMSKNGALDLLQSCGKKKAESLFNKEQAESYRKYNDATSYRNFVLKRRDSRCISSAMKEARTKVKIEQNMLDKDEFLLNTPSCTYDLREGISSARPHSATDYITKQTAVDPSDDGSAIWREALDTFFCEDDDLINYVQEIAGLAAIGKVCLEGLIIAYGEGRNGKSTFWNTLSRVLGTYSGSMSADTLTSGCKRNVKPELAETKGKRLIIAAELEEGMRLNTSTIKQLCSTDEIYAEKKYKDPFRFIPSHTLVLYTNHLPKVGAIDAGTWRRLIVIPFNAKIEGQNDKKNYADYLLENAGGAVLKWIMEGAKRVIEKEYHITKPAVVEEAVAKYKENNDWLSQFLEERCEVDPSYSERSGLVYDAYRIHCARLGEYARSTTDFYTALESAGFKKKRTSSARLILGLKLQPEEFMG